MDPTLDQLREIVESRGFNRLVGTVENDFFDCKDQPYRLAQGDAAKRELAKDISAFANTKGGYIFIGLRTEKSATHPSDEVKEVRPLDRSLVDTDQYQKVLAEWIYPAIEGIRPWTSSRSSNCRLQRLRRRTPFFGYVPR